MKSYNLLYRRYAKASSVFLFRRSDKVESIAEQSECKGSDPDHRHQKAEDAKVCRISGEIE
jgi:hypothetical protein